MIIIRTNLTEAQHFQIDVVVLISSCLTILGALRPLYRLWLDRSAGFSIAQKYYSILIFMNVLTASMFAFARYPGNFEGFCQVQAIFIQMGGLATQLFTAYISIKMYYLIVRRFSPNKLLIGINRDVFIIYTISFLYAMSLFAGGVYGRDADWCWIDGARDEIYRYYALYISLMVTMAITIGTLVYITSTVKGSSDKNLAEAERRIEHKLSLYVLIFNFCWFWGLVDRITESVTGETCFATTILQATFQPLQGFLNSLVYTNTHVRIVDWFYQRKSGLQNLNFKFYFKKNMNALRNAVLEVERASVSVNSPIFDRFSVDSNRPSSMVVRNTEFNEQTAKGTTLAAAMNSWEQEAYLKKHGEFTPSDSGNGSFKFKPKIYSIYSTTFNLGEAPVKELEKELPNWLPLGHDIYAIALQEALDISTIRESIHNYLGGTAKYAVFGEEIGSDNTMAGFHGHIALTIFARAEDVAAGFIRDTLSTRRTYATGANIGGVKASNKGGVGIPLQIHDTNVCFLSCHLPSDSKGVSKVRRRNASAYELIKNLGLSPNDLDLNSYYQCDHFYFMGDMNYRITNSENPHDMSSGGMVCETVARAARFEKNFILENVQLEEGSTWLKTRAQLLRVASDPLCPKGKLLDTLLEARSYSAIEWMDVLKDDELTQELAYGFLLNGFEEASISFAPSYKRKNMRKDGDLHAGDYTDATIVFNDFTNTQGMTSDHTKPPIENSDLSDLSDAAKHKILEKRKSKMRPPSYTDRVLVHSLQNRKKRLAVQSYDVQENVIISDHRPVTLVSTLIVNSNVLYPLNFVEEMDQSQLHEKKKNGEISVLGKDQYFFYEINIESLKIKMITEGDEHFSSRMKQKRRDTESVEDNKNSNQLRKAPERKISGQKYTEEVERALEEEDSDIDDDEEDYKKAVENNHDVASRVLDGKDDDASIDNEGFVDLEIGDSVNSKAPVENNEKVEDVKQPSSKPKLEKQTSTLGKIYRRASNFMTTNVPNEGEDESDKYDYGGHSLDGVDKLRVTFPMPCKDPLASFRRISDLAKVFEVEQTSILDAFTDVTMSALELKYRNSPKAEVPTDMNSLKSSVSEFKIGKSVTLAPSEGGDSHVKNDVIYATPMRLVGCVIPELGAHLLIGLVDKSGTTCGEICISVSEIMRSNTNDTHRMSIEGIPVTRGGVLKGKASGIISVALITILSEQDVANHPQSMRLSVSI